MGVDEMKEKLTEGLEKLGGKDEDAQQTAADTAGNVESAADDAARSAQDAAGSAGDTLGR